MQYSNKSTINFFVVLGLTFFLVSCASNSGTTTNTNTTPISTPKNETSWRSFYDENGGELKNVTFLEKKFTPNHKPKQFDEVGSAKIKNGKSFNIFKIADKQFGLINLDNQVALKSVSPQSLKSFSNAKSLKLYEFGGGILEVANFSSKDGVCNGFSSKTGVDLNFSTNYYSQYNVFTTLFGASKISLKKGVLSAQTLNITSHSDTEKDQALEDKIRSQSKKIIKSDINKLGIFLTFLCKKQ